MANESYDRYKIGDMVLYQRKGRFYAGHVIGTDKVKMVKLHMGVAKQDIMVDMSGIVGPYKLNEGLDLELFGRKR